MGCGASSQTKVLEEFVDYNDTQMSKSHESLPNTANSTNSNQRRSIDALTNSNSSTNQNNSSGAVSMWAEANGIKGYKGIQKGMAINYLDREAGSWKDAVVVNINEENLSITLKIPGKTKSENRVLFLGIDWKEIAPVELELSQNQKLLGKELNKDQLQLSLNYLLHGHFQVSEHLSTSGKTTSSNIDNSNIHLRLNESNTGSMSTLRYVTGQQVNVKDEYIRQNSGEPATKWRPAIVLTTSDDGMLVRIHYHNWDNKWDETLDLSTQNHRIRPIETDQITPTSINNMKRRKPSRRNSVDQSSHTNLQAVARFSVSNIDANASSVTTDHEPVGMSLSPPNNGMLITRYSNSNSRHDNQNIMDSNEINRNIEELFDKRMKLYGMTIVDVEGDGNCLFRAVSHQLYNNESHHLELRQQCVEHMRRHTKRFEIYCTSKFEDHLKRMALPCVWADYLEIRALEEIIDRLFYIYSPDTTEVKDNSGEFTVNSEPKPMNINYSEQPLLKDVTPIKLSYHGRSHYNSVVDARLSLPLSPRNTSVILDSRIKIFDEEEAINRSRESFSSSSNARDNSNSKREKESQTNRKSKSSNSISSASRKLFG
eukprot:gene21106-27348_t